ncbi:MAG: hypothetical protein FJY75_02350 [Candidatus Eisenbacteria bacterium]|uniref:6-bladed beta-propeller n=1 Tax=Eiseniibacteriota bacterium TaxID=2212470 RepID=A0A937X6W7_UNCEI|nr:hypothetical protein [Candidatus Eisenbacteria bacterium]
MKRLAVPFLSRLSVLFVAAALLPGGARADVPRVRNGDTPQQGVRTLRLSELWRAGGEEDEILFGAIGQAAADEEGKVYLLDRQLAHVQVFSPDGRLLGTLGREGDGPGELRRPRDLVLLPDAAIGVLQMSPGMIVKLARDGTPAGSIILGAGDPLAGGRHMAYGAACRGGSLVVCAEAMSPRAGEISQHRYLARVDETGGAVVRYLERTITQDVSTAVWDEAVDYFVHLGGWALGPDGRVYAAPVRDRYEIRVYRPDGTPELIITRPFKPRRRTAEEKERAQQSRRMIVLGREIDRIACDDDPVVLQMRVDGANRLWVLHGRSGHDQPEGVFQTYDIFDPDGSFVLQTAIACEGRRGDRLFFLGDDRALLVKGYAGAAMAAVGGGVAGGAAGEDEAAPPEVVCYRIPE